MWSLQSTSPHLSLSIKWVDGYYEIDITCTRGGRQCNVNILKQRSSGNGRKDRGVSFFTSL